MLRILGKPERSELLEGARSHKEIWHHYADAGDFPGELVVATDKRNGLIIGIWLYPEDLSKQKAIEHFGNDYLITKYDFDRCLGDGESAPLYESPSGEVTFIEYRQRGIALCTDYRGMVTDIRYVKGPIGDPFSRCKR